MLEEGVIEEGDGMRFFDRCGLHRCSEALF